MTTMSKSHMCLHFLLLLLLCSIFPSSFSTTQIHRSRVACHPQQIKAFTQFKNEFDSGRCNHNDDFNGVWCDNSTGAVTMLRLRACLSGTLKPNSSLFGFHQLRYLHLSENYFISSSLSSEFGNLNNLEVMYLDSNGFHGQVPSSFSNLSLLSYINLSKNKISGSIPPVLNLSKLTGLELAQNNFFGAIPSSLFTMPFLTHLDLSDNHLSGPTEISNSSLSSRLEMKVLKVQGNNFGKQIFEPISKLITLEYLDLSFLNISHPIDLSFFSSFKSLTTLKLSGNRVSQASLSSDLDIPLSLDGLGLSGCGISEFPNILKPLQNLVFIDISNNEIKGKVPAWLWSLPHLRSLDFCNNSLNGFEGSKEDIVKSSVEMMDLCLNSFEALPNFPTSIIYLSAYENVITGNIPLSICSTSLVDVLDLSYNNFTGPIPKCLSNCMFVNLRKNNLEGSIPDVFYAGASLRTLDVGYNRLIGKLPRSLLNCSYLRFLSVEHNGIKDAFPLWLKALPNLQVIVLRSNNFYGSISPPDQGSLKFPELQILEISNNDFTGSLPPTYFVNWKASSLQTNEDGSIYMGYEEKRSTEKQFYGYNDVIDLQYKGLSMEQEKVLTSYATIDFSGNRLEGQIPESIGFLKALIALNLSNNAFTGHIPLSLANVTQLESLDLSRNQLSGNIPSELNTLSFLAFLNVSHNQLKGEIPQGPQIIGQSKSSFEGNPGLCGLPLSQSCFDSSAPPMHQHKQEDKEEEEEEVLNWKAVATGYGAGVLLGLTIAQIFASYKPEWLAAIVGLNKRING